MKHLKTFAALCCVAAAFAACEPQNGPDNGQTGNNQYTLTVVSSDEAMGTVTGSGRYPAGSEIVITATANKGYSFQKWHDGNTDNPRTVTVIADATYTAIFAAAPTAGTENGHAWVDLGLPSGLKWATCNVGATFPEEYGDYFAWGETTTKETYEWSTYTLTTDGGTTFIKYNTTDGKTTLDLTDDAARANWGGAWRMPTDAEWQELIDNCTWTWTENYKETGIKGYEVKSKTNENSIFLPAAGFRSYGGLYNAGSYGDYWSSSLDAGDPFYALDVIFCSDYVFRGGTNLSYYRYYGRSVRAVID